jgi:hypothetical protein
MQKIILASNSPRRSQLLEWAESPFEIIVKHSSEDYPADMPVEEVPEYLGREHWRASGWSDDGRRASQDCLGVPRFSHAGEGD